MRELLTRVAEAALDLLYPPHCAVCEQPFFEERAFVCNECETKIERIEQSHVCRCGVPLPEVIDLCPECGTRDLALAQVRSFGWYEERENPHHVLSKLIKIFKYGGERALVPLLAGYLDEAGRQLRSVAELLTFVPMRPKAERQRGFNQAELLAGELGRRWNLPVVCALEKTKDTEPQARLSHAERQTNLAGAFRLANSISCASILLVDDVCTTGATLRECAKVLQTAGAARVYALTVARASLGDRV